MTRLAWDKLLLHSELLLLSIQIMKQSLRAHNIYIYIYTCILSGAGKTVKDHSTDTS